MTLSTILLDTKGSPIHFNVLVGFMAEKGVAMDNAHYASKTPGRLDIQPEDATVLAQHLAIPEGANS